MVYPGDEVLVVSGGITAFGDEGVEAYRRSAWVVINYDIIEKHKDWLLTELKDKNIDTVIFDEATYIKDTKTIRTKAALLLAAMADQVYLLTGTPVMNRPIELFPLLRAIKHKLAYSDDKPMSTLRKEYGKRYCAAYFHRLGYSGRGFWDETGASRISELREMTRDAFLRRTKAEVLNLPEKIVSIVECDLDSTWKEEYRIAWNKYLEWIAANNPDAKKIENILSAQQLIELGKLKQVCSLAKIARITADIENAVEQGEKVIVFTQYTKTVEELQTALHKAKIETVSLTGATKSEDRQQAVDDFQNNPDVKVFIANIKAGGVGITLTAASIVMFADMEWSPEIHRQAEDRAHRIGQTGTVNVYYYIANNTIEEDIIDILSQKQETIGVLTDSETTIKPFMERMQKKLAAS